MHTSSTRSRTAWWSALLVVATGCPGLPIPAAEPFDATVACVDDGG